MRVFFVLVLATVLVSCSPNEDDWLNKYARYKCEYNNLISQREKSETEYIYKQNFRFDSVQKIMDSLFSPEYEEMETLGKKLKQIENDYVHRYKVAQDKQSLKFGHRSTPTYEQQLEKLDSKRRSEIENIERQIRVITFHLQENDLHNKLASERKGIKDAIQNGKEMVKMEFKNRLDSIQEIVNQHRIYGRKIVDRINKEDLLNFELKKTKINKSPCDYVN